MNCFQTHSRKGNWIAVVLSIALAIGLIWPARAAPMGRDHGDLVITGSGTNRQYYCPGDQVDFFAWVAEEVVTGFFSNSLFGAAGATILVNGWPKATTNQFSRADWTETAGEPGEVEITITASKPGYGSSGEATISYEVLECYYSLQINYEESYDFAEKGNFTEFAAVSIQGKLMIDESGSLVSESGGNTLTGSYVVKGRTQFEDQVLNCWPSNLPSGSNPFTISFSGKRTNGTLTLKLEQVAISQPIVVNWSCEPDLNGNVAEMMSVANPTVNLIEKAGLSQLSFPAGGGSKPITITGGGLFWANQEMTGQGSISLILLSPVSWLP